jgi:hypothetical protein
VWRLRVFGKQYGVQGVFYKAVEMTTTGILMILLSEKQFIHQQYVNTIIL